MLGAGQCEIDATHSWVSVLRMEWSVCPRGECNDETRRNIIESPSDRPRGAPERK